jgi:N-methylhydantoinase B
VRDLWDALTRNSRLADQLRGDLSAQVAVSRLGEQRYAEILARYGRETVTAATEEIFRQTEELDRDAVAAIPD